MQPTNSAQAFVGLQSAQASAQDPNSILQAQQQQMGVNGAQDTVTGLRGAINNTTKLLSQVAPSVMGRTANSLVTNAQATRQIGDEQAPIATRLGQENTDYNQANSDLQNLEGRAQTAANGIYAGQQDKLSYAQNLYNTLYQKERDAQAAQQAETDRQEQIRQFNASLASKNAGGSTFNLGGGASTSPSSAVSPTNAVNKTQNDYNFVKGLVDEVNNGNGDAIASIIRQARGGNARSKDVMRAFYQLQNIPIPKNFRSFL